MAAIEGNWTTLDIGREFSANGDLKPDHYERASVGRTGVFGERHLGHLLNSYQKYYNEGRTPLWLHKDAPVPRTIQTVGRMLTVPILGGLHQQYFRAFAIRRPEELLCFNPISLRAQ
jgi:hypothetical protein